MDPSPYPPPKGGGWRAKTEGPAPTPLSLPLERGGGAQRRRGSIRPRPLSVGEPTPNPIPSATQQPKGGGRLVSTHAALSPELGSSLKAQSGRKSGTTAPGVQGAGRGPLATSLVPFLFAQERNPPVGAGPDNPSGRMPENFKEGNPSSRGSQPAGMPENPRRGSPSNPIPATAQQPKEKASGLRGSKFPAGGNKVGPSPYPPPEGEALAVPEGAAFYRGSRKTLGGGTPKKEAEGRHPPKPPEGAQDWQRRRRGAPLL